MKIQIIYYSGVGNTKMVATKIFAILQEHNDVSIASIENYSGTDANVQYDALIIGFPTIHASPAQPIRTFIEKMRPVQYAIPTYLFTTCGLYSANALRIFAKECRDINLIPIMNKRYRCAATDGVLLVPYMKFLFHHEKRLDEKILNDTCTFTKLLNKKLVIKVPRFKLYSILNYPNKMIGQRSSPRIYTHKENCIRCEKCILSCPMETIVKDHKGYPVIENSSCIHCYRCIHHCPYKALSLSKTSIPSKTLYDYYK